MANGIIAAATRNAVTGMSAISNPPVNLQLRLPFLVASVSKLSLFTAAGQGTIFVIESAGIMLKGQLFGDILC